MLNTCDLMTLGQESRAACAHVCQTRTCRQNVCMAVRSVSSAFPFTAANAAQCSKYLSGDSFADPKSPHTLKGVLQTLFPLDVKNPNFG